MSLLEKWFNGHAFFDNWCGEKEDLIHCPVETDTGIDHGHRY